MFSWATFIHVVMCTYTSDLTIPCEYKACFIYSVRYRVVSYLTVVMDAILNHAQASPWVPVFSSLGIITRCGSAGSYGSFCVWIFNNRQVFFLWWMTSAYILVGNVISISVSPHPPFCGLDVSTKVCAPVETVLRPSRGLKRSPGDMCLHE